MPLILVNNSTTVPAAATALSALADKRIAFFDAENMGAGALDTTQATTAKLVVAAMGRGAGKAPLTSQPIPVAKIKSAIRRAYAAGSGQVSRLGFNGTSGSLGLATFLGALAITDSRPSYGIRFTDLIQGFEPFKRSSIEYTAASGDREFDVANALAKANDAKSDSPVSIALFVNQASAAIANARTLTVTNGSVTVTASGTDHNVATGDVIRIGHATALTSPVYVVAGVSGATITLDRPYQGASASGVAAGELSAAITTQATGMSFTHKTAGGSFNTSVIGDWPSSVLAVIDTAPTTPQGLGTDLHLAFEENAGVFGEFYRFYLPSDLENPVDKTMSYDVITVEYANEIDRHIARPAGVNELVIGIQTTGTLDLATFFGV